VVLAVLMNVAGYWFSDRLALRASRAKPVEPGRLPELEAMVQDVAQHAQVPTPRLFLMAHEFAHIKMDGDASIRLVA